MYYDELKDLSDDELEAIYLPGENLHIHNSKASTAKRILDSLRQKNQPKAINIWTNNGQVAVVKND